MGDDHFHIGRGGDDHLSPKEDADGNLMESVVNLEIVQGVLEKIYKDSLRNV